MSFLSNIHRWYGRIRGRGAGRRPPGFRITSRLLSGALGLVYLVAFLSLLVQVKGLLGARGILPVGAYLAEVHQALGGTAFRQVPTLAWLTSGDGGLLTICVAGAAAGLLVVLDVAPLYAAAVAWLLYLSVVTVGQDFLAFQWDTLLLEAGFLLLFLIPPGVLPGRRRRDDPWFPAIWLFRWLLFRLILESGLVKLASGDPTWRNLTAVAYHYQTQPIPNLVAWYAYHLPLRFQEFSTFVTFVVELAVPFLFLLPRRPRIVGGVLVVGHQCLIALTGNFGFFNLLTIAIATGLFDDAFWRALVLRLLRGRRLLTGALGGPPIPRPRPGVTRRVATLCFLVVAVVVGCGQVVRAAGRDRLPGPVVAVWQELAPFDVLNSYGLFANMTTSRPELILEGRHDGGPWREIDFRWKAGALDERPRQVAPYMPRLDWQMWFAALRAESESGSAPGRMRYDAWLLRFVERLLAGTPQVWGLLASNAAFRGPRGEVRPPDEIRVLLYEYRFTTFAEHTATGDWWERRAVGEYLPPVRRTADGHLQAVSR